MSTDTVEIKQDFTLNRKTFYLDLLISIIIGSSVFYLASLLFDLELTVNYVHFAFMVITLIAYGSAYFRQYNKYRKANNIKWHIINPMIDNTAHTFEILAIYNYFLVTVLYTRFFTNNDVLIGSILFGLSLGIRLTYYALARFRYNLEVSFMSFTYYILGLLLYLVHLGTFLLIPSSSVVVSYLVTALIILILLFVPNINIKYIKSRQGLVLFITIIFLWILSANSDIYFGDGTTAFRFYGTNYKENTSIRKEFEYLKKMIIYEDRVYVATNETVDIYDMDLELIKSHYIRHDDINDPYYGTFMIFESNEGVVLVNDTPDAEYLGRNPYENFELDLDDTKTIYTFDENGDIVEFLVINGIDWSYVKREYIFQFTEEGLYFSDRPNAFHYLFDSNGTLLSTRDILDYEYATDTFYVDNSKCTEENLGYACSDLFNHRYSTSFYTYDFSSPTLYHKGFVQYNKVIYDIENEELLEIEGIDFLLNDVMEYGVRSAPHFDTMMFKVYDEGYLIIGDPHINPNRDVGNLYPVTYFVSSIDKNGNIIDYLFIGDDYVFIDGEYIYTLDDINSTNTQINTNSSIHILSKYKIADFFNQEKGDVFDSTLQKNHNLEVKYWEVILPLVITTTLIICYKPKRDKFI